jgi:hypothetical protein
MHPVELETARARVHYAQKMLDALGVDSDEYVSAIQASQNDVVYLLAEVDRLRMALAGHLFDGESLDTREAVRTGMIQMGITAYDALRGVTKLVDEIDWHQEREGCAVDMHTPNGWVDVKDRLAAILAAAQPSPALPVPARRAQ